MSDAPRIIAALAAGLLFGFGLALSGMLDPSRVLGFLDLFAIVKGGWDASLAFVLGGAAAVSFAGIEIAKRLGRPLIEAAFDRPAQSEIDRPLLVGSALFGIGWGLAGFCPGPAIAALSFMTAKPLVFLAAMTAGALLFHAWQRGAVFPKD